MHCQRRLQPERGIAITLRARRSTLVEARWAIQSCRAISMNREMDQAMPRAVIVHRTFRHRNLQHVIRSTIERHCRQLKVNAACGISETRAS